MCCEGHGRAVNSFANRGGLQQKRSTPGRHPPESGRQPSLPLKARASECAAEPGANAEVGIPTEQAAKGADGPTAPGVHERRSGSAHIQRAVRSRFVGAQTP